MFSIVVLATLAVPAVCDDFFDKRHCDGRSLKRYEFSVDISIPTCRLPNGDERLELDEMSEGDAAAFRGLFPGVFVPPIFDILPPMGNPREGLECVVMENNCGCEVCVDNPRPTSLNGIDILQFEDSGQFVEMKFCRDEGSSCDFGTSCVTTFRTRFLAVPGRDMENAPVEFRAFSVMSGCQCENVLL